MHDAKTHLSQLVERALAGEEIVVTRRGEPTVRLTPVERPRGRDALVGLMAGEIEIAPDVAVKTWNNSFSDISDDTLIEPSDPLFDRVLKLKDGQVVTFSGRFPADDANCIRESSLTLKGNLETPGFIMKFSSVR